MTELPPFSLFHSTSYLLRTYWVLGSLLSAGLPRLEGADSTLALGGSCVRVSRQGCRTRSYNCLFRHLLWWKKSVVKVKQEVAQESLSEICRMGKSQTGRESGWNVPGGNFHRCWSSYANLMFRGVWLGFLLPLKSHLSPPSSPSGLLAVPGTNWVCPASGPLHVLSPLPRTSSPIYLSAWLVLSPPSGLKYHLLEPIAGSCVETCKPIPQRVYSLLSAFPSLSTDSHPTYCWFISLVYRLSSFTKI